MNRQYVKGCSLALSFVAATAGLSGCGGGNNASTSGTPSTPLSASSAALQAVCPTLVGSAVQGGSVTSAAFVPATTGTVNANSFPDHCLVRGAINRRTGTDGQPYAIEFELRLPSQWNSRFFYQGGSGVDGTLFTATGAYPGGGATRNALLDGYAVVTTDSGHEAIPGVANGQFLFGVDPQARLEYGYAQLPLVTGAAKTLIAKFYGSAPVKSYFVGCSNGGRQAMIAAQQFPDLFDGIIAGAPGFRLAQASVQALYQAQLSATVSPLGSDGRPDITQSLTPAEQSTVSNRIVAECSPLGGVNDGMVSRMSACHPDPATWVCAAGQTTNCLTPAKAAFVKSLFAGAKTSGGTPIYASWPYDPGMAAQFGNPFYSIFAGEASHVYTSPPTVTTDLLGYGLNASIDTEYAKLFTTTDVYTTPGVTFTNGESPNMDAFSARGGKLMMYNGSADLAFSINDVVQYYKEVQARYGSDATSQFARTFLVPGMGHCSGGQYGTDQFDAFGAMVNWVEKGTAPDVMISTARADAGVAWPGRTRPLCAYPKEAVYKGSGSIEDATNFACQ